MKRRKINSDYISFVVIVIQLLLVGIILGFTFLNLMVNLETVVVKILWGIVFLFLVIPWYIDQWIKLLDSRDADMDD